MNINIEKLYQLASRKERRILGLMSGTSFDGLDLALCQITNSGRETKITVEEFETIAYDPDFRTTMKQIATAVSWTPADITQINIQIAKKWAGIINDFLNSRQIPNHSIDLIASHGQTFHHFTPAEGSPATMQLGDGDHIARLTGIITLSDFRQKNIAAGGEGAPLAPYGDLIMFSDEHSDVILLNIGGISNFSFIPARKQTQPVICSDIGPGNALMDACMQKYFNKLHFDEGGKMAEQGKVIPRLLESLFSDPFFARPFPKSTGIELFNTQYLENSIRLSQINEPSRVDIMATLNFFTAKLIAEAIRPLIREGYNTRLYVSGGGAHNPVLQSNLKKLLSDLPINFFSPLEKGIHPDAKEAVLFALLANECVAGNADIFKGNGNFMPAVQMGKVSFPG